MVPSEKAGKGRRQEEWTPGKTPREDFLSHEKVIVADVIFILASLRPQLQPH